MPSVYLTEEQRNNAALQKKYQRIADGLAAFKNREKLKQSEIAKGLGVNHQSVRKLMDAEVVRLDVISLLKVIHLAGYQIVKREEEKNDP